LSYGRNINQRFTAPIVTFLGRCSGPHIPNRKWPRII